MAPDDKHGAQQSQSLTSILPSARQRAELTELLVECINRMRRGITDTFDPRYAGTAFDAHFDGIGKETAAAAEGGPDDVEAAKEKALDEAREQAANRIKELSKPEVQELKKAALVFFEEWKDNVLKRVGEVLGAAAAAQEKEEQKPAEGEGAARITVVKEAEKQETPVQDAPASTAPQAGPPVVKTPLADLGDDDRRHLVQALLLMMLSLECYTAYSRTLLLGVSRSLDIPVKLFIEDETDVAKGLLKAAELNADDIAEQKAKEGSSSRKWKVGLAAAAGAAVIGVTGGLAAPLLAAGVGTVMGGLGLAETAAAAYLGSMAGSTVLIGSLFGAYGGRMTGKVMDDYAKEVEDFAFVPLHRFRRFAKDDGRRLRVLVGISGWLSDKADVVDPWRVLAPSAEGFALKYELEALLALGNALVEMVMSKMWGVAKKQILKRTVFFALKEAMWPLNLLKVGDIIDNPFSVAKARSDKAGEVLADALINKVQGERPVTLVGYSLGARVIYTCLKALAKRKAFGLIEDVILMGCPSSADSADWRELRAVVSGRLVNVYSDNDMVLAFLYRTSSARMNIAGLRPTEFVKGVENVDASDIVSGHLRYRYLNGAILQRIGFEDLDMDEVLKEQAALAKVEEAAQTEAKKKEEEAEEKGKTEDQQVEELKAEVQKKTEQSIMDKASEKLHVGHEKAGALWRRISHEDRDKDEEGKTASEGGKDKKTEDTANV